MGMKALDTAVATSHGGGDGQVKSNDGVIDLDVKTPRELGGPGGRATNPEQLFAAGHAACFEGALRPAGGLQKTVPAHQVCPYPVATRGNVEGKLVVA